MTVPVTVTAPRRVQDLQRAIARLAVVHGSTSGRLQALIASVVLSQMLPDSAVKGGTGLKLRFGDRLTRATPDLDTAFRGDLDVFEVELKANLDAGWGPFSGKVKRVDPHIPGSGHVAYIMQPFRVSLTYQGKAFAGVDVEVGFDELEATTRDAVEEEMSAEICALFVSLGLDIPRPVRVLPLHHQIAQKLHACTEPGSDRAHDLVDLQIMAPRADRDLVAITATRLFNFRRQQEWVSAAVTAGDGWETKYSAAADGLHVLADVTSAAAWANGYIEELRSL